MIKPHTCLIFMKLLDRDVYNLLHIITRIFLVPNTKNYRNVAHNNNWNFHSKVEQLEV